MKSSAVLFIALTALSSNAFATGKKPPEAPTLSTPKPVRLVITGEVGTKPFTLPNGSQVKLNAHLEEMLATAITQTHVFRPLSAQISEGACDSYLRLVANVTTLEMNTLSVDATFGYTPDASLQPITKVTGKVGVKLGTVAMDFRVEECQSNGQCAAIIASRADQRTLGGDVQFEIDFGLVTAGPHLIYNTDLGKKLGKVMDEGLKKLAADPALSFVPWQTEVREVNAEAGTVIIGAGRQDGLAANQSFEIYAPREAGGACRAFKVVAFASTLEPNTVSSRASIDSIQDPRGIRVGDVVMVREAK